MKSYESRINLDIPLETLSNVVCDKYKLGKFIDNAVIKIGYEDYNYILTTEKGKFVVKVFLKSRTEDECQNLADRATIPYENNILCPKIYKINRKNLFVTKIKNTTYRLIVMDYIDGKDFFSLKSLPNNKELKFIGQELAKLNQLQYKPEFVYDSCAIINFSIEFDKHKHILASKERTKLAEVVKELNTCDFTKLKHSFVHGDIIPTNIIKHSSGKIYFIDFSVSNYLPRIIDLAVAIGDLCLDLNDIKKSKKRTTLLLNAYQTIDKLSNYEKDCLKTFLKAHQATSILFHLRENKIEGFNSEENKYYIDNSRLALEILSKIDLIK